MKKLVLMILISAAFVASATAQKRFENNPKVQEARQKFYNQELGLTADEQKAFWPLFEAMKKEQQALNKEYRPKKNRGAMNDAELTADLDRQYEFDQKKAELKKKYTDKFSEVLPVRKVALIEATERKFKKEVLKKVRQNRARGNKKRK